MPYPNKSKEEIIAAIMRKHKSGSLKSSSGDKVQDRKQALAIALSEAKRYSKKG